MEARLRDQFTRLHPKPKWASAPSDNASKSMFDSDGEDAAAEESDADAAADRLLLFRDTRSKLLSSDRCSVIAPDHIHMTRARDANYQERSESVVSTLDWHPTHNILLTAGLDKTLRLFAIDGKTNAKVQSLHLADMPISNACFTPGGTEIILAGRRRFFYTYDLERGQCVKVPEIHRGAAKRDEIKSLEHVHVSKCGRFIAFHGRDGEIVLLSAKSKQYVGSLQMNGSVRAIDFAADGRTMYSTGGMHGCCKRDPWPLAHGILMRTHRPSGDGEIYEWDLGMRRCVSRFTDEGALNNTAIAISPTGTRLASGSESGVVNLYDTAVCRRDAPAPTPIRALPNLTTHIEHVRFNHDGQLLVASSRVQKDQLKVVHVPTARVYANWPTMGTPLGYVQSVGFSARSEYLAVGNAKGKVLLYALNHYH